jgi:hypothetical protein
MDSTKPVQGVAVYAEFSRDAATTQIIVTPRGFNEDDVEICAWLIRRTITKDNPRKQWRFSGLPTPTPKEIDARRAIDPDALMSEMRADLQMRYAQSLFDQIVRGGWSMVKDPVLVEVSKSDLTAVSKGKTPTKLLYRISSCRTALGFPADLINAAAV